MRENPILSLSETEALALKAARGAGLDWGLAEEAAFAARWLTEQGLDGLGLLAAQLAQDTGPLTISNRCWRAQDARPLSAITTGVALGDHFALPDGPLAAPLALSSVAFPALLLPFVATAAARANVVARVEWQACHVMLAGAGILVLEGHEAVLAAAAQDVRVTTTPRYDARLFAARTTPPAPMQDLTALAHKTYVPASDQSRRDAGAEGSDNA